MFNPSFIKNKYTTYFYDYYLWIDELEFETQFFFEKLNSIIIDND